LPRRMSAAAHICCSKPMFAVLLLVGVAMFIFLI
jgi:hypothetical protein